MKRLYIGIILVLIFIAIGFAISYKEKEVQVQRNIEKQTEIILDDRIIPNMEGQLVDNKIYLPIEFFKENFSLDINISQDNKRALISLSDIEFQLETHELTNYVKDKDIEINLPVLVKDNKKYIPTKELSKLLRLEIHYKEASQNIIIDKYQPKIILGKTKGNSEKVKIEPSFPSFTIANIKSNEAVRVFHQEDGWYKVRTELGYIGYIHKDKLNTYEKITESDYRLSDVRAYMDKTKKINITWEYVYEKTPDISKEDRIEGLDVISPTWFSLEGDGTIKNKADLDYVVEAQEMGYKVWGLVDNSFDPKITSNIINNDELKKRVIAQLAFYSSLYNLDGINIDFENIYYEDKDAFSEFVEELTYILKKQNLIISIDVTVPGGSKQWSLVYDRERIAKTVDFVALMAYDEHWGTSPVSGSVASIGWVERGIVGSLETIPKDKLLLGIPFYTRVWKETIDENGKLQVSSKAVPIRNVQDIINENDAIVIWDKKTGQNYAAYEKDGAQYKIWIEDSESIELKVALARKYDLKGIASWRKGYEYEEVWEVIKEAMNSKTLL